MSVIFLLSPSLNSLQDLAYLANSYAQKLNIIFNYTKSTGTLFKLKQFCFSSPKLFLGSDTANFFDTVTYLSVKLNSLLTNDDDIYRQVCSIYCAANKLKAKFPNAHLLQRMCFFAPTVCSFFQVNIVKQIFSKSSYHRIKVAYNDTFRI